MEMIAREIGEMDMADIPISDSEQTLNEEDIRQTERDLGTALPPEYRHFLLQHNGGRPERNYFQIEDGNGDSLIDWFLCIRPGDANDLASVVRMFQNRVPRTLLPIARDPFGNLICIAVSGENVGKVYFWDHEEEVAEGEIPDYRNLHLVSESFDRFLEGLTPLPG